MNYILTIIIAISLLCDCHIFFNNWYLQLIGILCKFQVFQKGILHLHNQFFKYYSLFLFQLVLKPLCINFLLIIIFHLVCLSSVSDQFIFCIWYFELFTFVFMYSASVYYPYLKPWAVFVWLTTIYFWYIFWIFSVYDFSPVCFLFHSKRKNIWSFIWYHLIFHLVSFEFNSIK